MSAIDNLIAGERALIDALDADDAAAVAQASADLASLLTGMRSDPVSRPAAEEALRLADLARARINLLADRTERRLARLAAIGGRETPVYGRDARMRR